MAATFEVSSTSALIWVSAPEATGARIDVQRANSNRPGNTRFGRTRKHYMKIRAERGNTGVYQLEKLEPNRIYRYRVQIGNGDGTDWYTLRTAPDPEADAPVHFVFGAEFSNDPRFDTSLLTSMAASGAEFFISLGDWPYTDLPVQDRKVDQYRSSHRLARSLPKTQALMKTMPLYAIYDDHDIKNDWDSSLIEQSRKRVQAGLQVWDEFFPVRDDNPDVLQKRRYRTWSWGKHAQFFMLDTRLYRSNFKDEDTRDKTMLGKEQLRWLQDGLVASKATFKLILTTVPLDFGTTREHWRAYKHERNQLLAFLRDRRISGVVFLTGDQHWASVHHLFSGHREYQTGPLSSFLRDPPDERPRGVLYEAAVPNYGEVMITSSELTSGQPPRLIFSVRDERGGLLYIDAIEATVPAPFKESHDSRKEE